MRISVIEMIGMRYLRITGEAVSIVFYWCIQLCEFDGLFGFDDCLFRREIHMHFMNSFDLREFFLDEIRTARTGHTGDRIGRFHTVKMI